LALLTAYKLSGMPLASLFLVVPSLTFSVPDLRAQIRKSRLKKFLAASSCSASHLADALLLELRRWSGAEEKRTHGDDITLLVLDFLPSP
jgi:hypothetical protein